MSTLAHHWHEDSCGENSPIVRILWRRQSVEDWNDCGENRLVKTKEWRH